MDFNDAPAEAEYRTKVREWLTANTAKYKGLPDPANNAEFVARAKDWQKTKYQAGYTGLTWPKAMGGQGLGPMQSIIFSQEEGKTPAPTGLYAIGLGMCIPTVFTHGSAEVTQRDVPKALEGEEIWCQLFSEPSAGSDLANLRTKAVQDGDAWIEHERSFPAQRLGVPGDLVTAERATPAEPTLHFAAGSIEPSGPPLPIQRARLSSGQVDTRGLFQRRVLLDHGSTHLHHPD